MSIRLLSIIVNHSALWYNHGNQTNTRKFKGLFDGALFAIQLLATVLLAKIPNAKKNKPLNTNQRTFVVVSIAPNAITSKPIRYKEISKIVRLISQKQVNQIWNKKPREPSP
ncbi:hypothetical protein ACT8ZR_11795 [Neobacillus sp. M.A.Huq-85]|nr:hypothetical protein QNK12_29065 [Neobacillus cucumis]